MLHKILIMNLIKKIDDMLSDHRDAFTPDEIATLKEAKAELMKNSSKELTIDSIQLTTTVMNALILIYKAMTES